MKTIFLLGVLFSAAVVANCEDVAANSEDASEFIIGGNDAWLGQFPHMISIRNQNGNHMCGGGIINPRWILTAAHCIMSGNERFIVAGAVRLSDPGERYPISRSFPHPRYEFTDSNWHDIGLIRLGIDIRFNQNVQPIRLNRRVIDRNTPAQLSGHGHYTTDLSHIRASNHLQFKNTTIMTNAECTRRTAIAGILVPEYRPIIYPGHLCTLVRRGVGGCFGDSGSPLITDGGVVAVVSFGLSCARGAPDILVRVTSYLPWIDFIMWLH